MPTMMKPRLKMAMAAAEMLYSAAQECGDAGASGGARRPLTCCACPQVSDAPPSVVPVSQVRTLRARDETISSEWHMSKGWGQDVHTT